MGILRRRKTFGQQALFLTLDVQENKVMRIKAVLHYACSLPCVGYEAQHKWNVHATQIIRPISSKFLDYLATSYILYIFKVQAKNA